MAFLYRNLVMYGVAFLFQLLSFAGVATDINMMVWMIGHEVAAVHTLIYLIINWYMYENSYAACKADTASNLCSLTAKVQMDTAETIVHEAVFSFELYANHEAWAMAQYMALSPEKQ